MSPRAHLAAALAWFAARWRKACACQPLDLRMERGVVECGACGRPVARLP